jgi:hypothetical protein
LQVHLTLNIHVHFNIASVSSGAQVYATVDPEHEAQLAALLASRLDGERFIDCIGTVLGPASRIRESTVSGFGAR